MPSPELPSATGREPDFFFTNKLLSFPLCRALTALSLLLLVVQEIIARNYGLTRPSQNLSPTFLAPASLAAFALFCLMSPRVEWRRVVVAGLALEAVRIVLHLLAGRDPVNLILFPGFGLGVASWGFLAWKVLVSQGGERRRTLNILAAALAVPFGHLLLWPSIMGTIPFLPDLTDNMLIALDASLGFQPTGLVGALFEALPPFHILHLVVYFQIPLAMYLIAGLEERRQQRMGVGLIPACLAAAVIGYFLYFLMPAVGPRPYFGDGFAQALQQLAVLPTEPLVNTTNPRNAMPSLHMTWGLLIYLAARPLGRGVHIGAALFALGTALATMGLGEHYFIDLVVAVPLVLLVRALCAVQVRVTCPERCGAFALGAALLLGWALIAQGLIDPTPWPGFAPLLMLSTVAASVLAERALLRAERSLAARQPWRLRAAVAASGEGGPAC